MFLYFLKLRQKSLFFNFYFFLNRIVGIHKHMEVLCCYFLTTTKENRLFRNLYRRGFWGGYGSFAQIHSWQCNKICHYKTVMFQWGFLSSSSRKACKESYYKVHLEIRLLNCANSFVFFFSTVFKNCQIWFIIFWNAAFTSLILCCSSL